MYSGDEFYDDDITSGAYDDRWWDEPDFDEYGQYAWPEDED